MRRLKPLLQRTTSCFSLVLLLFSCGQDSRDQADPSSREIHTKGGEQYLQIFANAMTTDNAAEVEEAIPYVRQLAEDLHVENAVGYVYNWAQLLFRLNRETEAFHVLQLAASEPAYKYYTGTLYLSVGKRTEGRAMLLDFRDEMKTILHNERLEDVNRLSLIQTLLTVGILLDEGNALEVLVAELDLTEEEVNRLVPIESINKQDILASAWPSQLPNE